MQVLGKIGLKINLMFFSLKMFSNGILGKPAQTEREMRIFKAIFENFIQNSNKKLKIFEWGSGFSTVYYADYLRQKSAEFEWHSIDNNKVWHEKIEGKISKKNLQNNVKLYLKKFLPFWQKPEWGIVPPPCGEFSPKSREELEYINFPSMLKEKFDIVIIDARFRRHCLKTAKEVLAPGGVVILHDAQKQHYYQGVDSFSFQKFYDTGTWVPFQKTPNKMWVGSMDSRDILDLLDGK